MDIAVVEEVFSCSFSWSISGPDVLHTTDAEQESPEKGHRSSVHAGTNAPRWPLYWQPIGRAWFLQIVAFSVKPNKTLCSEKKPYNAMLGPGKEGKVTDLC